MTSSSPKSSSTSESANNADTGPETFSATTSAPELTSSQNITSSSSTSNVAVELLRRELELAKLQLRQRDAELQKVTHSVEAARSRPTIDTDAAVALFNNVHQLRCDEVDLREKLEDVTKVCDGVLKNVQGTTRNSENIRVSEIINRYNEQFEGLTRQLFTAQQENGRLKATHISNETKISAIIHENAFLKSENDYLQDEVNELKRRCNEHHRIVKTLEAEIADLKRTHQTQLVTTKENLIDNHQHLLDQRLYEIESLRREIADRQKEHNRCLLRAQAHSTHLERERDRYEKFANELSQSLHALTVDNQHLLSQVSALKHSAEVEQLNSGQRADRMEAERNDLAQKLSTLQTVNDRLKSAMDATGVDDRGRIDNALNATVSEERLETAHATIACLRQQVHELKVINQHTHSPQSDLLKRLKEKCLELVEQQHTVKSLETQCQRLTEERCNATVLLVEMSKDMRTLLDAQRQLHLRSSS